MRAFHSRLRYSHGFITLLVLAVAGFAACRRADLPEKNSPQYTSAVRAFYVGLSALQVGDDVRAEEKLKEATALAPDEPAGWANLGLLYALSREVGREGEGGEQEELRLLQSILEVEPRNLSVRLDVARLAAKRGDAQLFAQMTAGFAEESSAWPPEAQAQL